MVILKNGYGCFWELSLMRAFKLYKVCITVQTAFHNGSLNWPRVVSWRALTVQLLSIWTIIVLAVK